CVLEDCTPRDVYKEHLDELKKLLELPGGARRETVRSEIVMPKNIPVASAAGPPTGLDPASLEGIVIDDIKAEKAGNWTHGEGLKGYVGYGYLYASANTGASIRFVAKAEKAGRYDVRIAYLPH